MRGIYIIVVLALAMICAAASVCAQSVNITGPRKIQLQEGKKYTITWSSHGTRIVDLIAYGTLTPLGDTPRGDYTIKIAENVPADKGSVTWTVPWIDSRIVTIKIIGYGADAKVLDTNQRAYEFRPAVLANRFADGIYLDLHKRTDQRLYVQKKRRITTVYITSSSENYLWVPRNRHPAIPHDHAGVFKVLDKSRDHFSRLFKVPMPWAMRYYGGHFIHATSPNFYPDLGRAASHGCNRLTIPDAKALFESTPVGTRVEIIGPSG